MRLTISSCLIFLSFVFVSPKTAGAQVNYIPAKVVSINGDTLNGFINYQEWERSPVSIKFKTSENGKVINFRPRDISAFTVENDYYRSMVIWVTY